MSTTELLTTLSNDFMWLLEYADDYNILIRVGEGQRVRTFKAHSIVLRARSTYFRYALSSEWATIEGNTYYFTKPNITPESFEIILNYIYSGEVSLKKFDGEKILELLVAADELCLNELLEYVQDYFVKNGNGWLRENINEYCHIIFQHDNFQKLQDYCIKMVSNDPQKFRRYGRFMQWPDDLVIGILKRDDLHLEEIDVWNILIKWGTAQVNLSFNNPNDWSSEDFSKLALKLKDCIQYIRFYHISGADFFNHVRPFKTLLPEDLYQELLHYHQFNFINNNNKHQLNNILTILPPRGIALDSKLIGTKHAALIASWIDREENFNPVKCHLVPYQFNLLLRGSRDDFKCSTFHKLCDNQGPALIVLKVKGTGELLGGYNPNGWNSTGAWIESTESFIFSLGDGKDPAYSQAILSRVKYSNSKCAIDDSPCIGPCFGTSDLVMVESLRHANGKFIYDLPWSCIQSCYERIITSTTNFTIEDYEVFKLIQKTP
uniref:Ectoderm-neural cortex protein 1 n=1 Tax=Anthurium amnicola TaxID=1678845 RepID=A0A1D1XM49_9ARAE